MATSSTTFDVANDTLATYRLLAERREGLAANSWPATTRETVSFLLGMADDQCDLLARVGDLADAVRLQGVESLPEEVRPECELVVEHYLALPDASALRFATQARVDLLARALARPDSEINSDPNAIAMLDEPFGAQYLRLENAVGLLYNQVQNYNAKSWAQSWE